ncbi:hypothetical protein ACWUXM_19345, partial [Acinetobacter baumannii]
FGIIKILSRERCFVGAPLNFAGRITAHEAPLNIDYWRGFFLLIILNILIFYSFIFIDKI